MKRDLLGLVLLLSLALPTGALALTLTGNVQFQGNLSVTGTLAKGAGTFVIDHPTKPYTHLLYHSFVESPDVKNVYDGIAVLDGKGEATIELPAYFDALNKDYRFQFFPHDEAMPDLHAKGILNRTLTIAGGKPGGKISWQVTGIRHDPFIEEYPIVVEVEKDDTTLVKKGECLFEEACR